MGSSNSILRLFLLPASVGRGTDAITSTDALALTLFGALTAGPFMATDAEVREFRRQFAQADESYAQRQDNGNGKLTDEQKRAAELRIMDDPCPAQFTDAERQRISATPWLDELFAIDASLHCFGHGCCQERPCTNCITWRKKVRLEFHRADHGKVAHPSDYSKPKKAAEIIHAWFWAKYQPAFKRGRNIIVCANGDELNQ